MKKSPVSLSKFPLLFQRGDFSSLEEHSRSLIGQQPRNGQAWYWLGMSLLATQQSQNALQPLYRASELRPDDAALWHALGIAHNQLGQFGDADACYKKSLKHNPARPEVWANAAKNANDTCDFSNGEQYARKSIKLNTHYIQAHTHLGVALKGLGKFKEALEQFRFVADRCPTSAEALLNLGVAQYDLGQYEAAVENLSTALHCNPANETAHINLAAAFQELGRPDDCIAHLKSVLQINPNNALAHGNLGMALKDLGDLQGALAHLRQSLVLDAHNPVFIDRLGGVYQALGRHDLALNCYEHILTLDTNNDVAMFNMGSVLHKLGNQIDSFNYLEKASRLSSKDYGVYLNMGNTLMELGRFDEALTAYSRAHEINPDHYGVLDSQLFCLNYHPDKTAEEIFDYYRNFDAIFGQPHHTTWRPHDNDRSTGRRLRIGYVSPDFKQNHPLRHFVAPLLTHYDKSRFEVYAYAELLQVDVYSEHLKSLVDHWVLTKGVNDEELAERIRADGIDILIDLAGHTVGNRLPVFARKPAPVQVSWLGYGYTTGLSAIDWYLGDQLSTPPGCEHLFSERVWSLPETSAVYRPADGMGECSSLPALEREYITFGTLSRTVRVNHRTIRVWAEILKRVPDAKLRFDSRNFKDPKMCERLVADFAAHGVTADRLIMGFNSPPWNVLREMDIGLDCFPHNSGTTLFETLYMGLPFITLADRPSVGRLGSMILHGIGHPEWIARTEDEYVEIAVALAKDIPRLAVLRAGLRQKMEASALMDETGFTRKLEAAYQEMWATWCGEDLKSRHEQPSPPLTIEQTLQQAIAKHQAGELNAAGQLYRAILASVAHHPDANHNLGVLAVQTGHVEAGLPHFKTALEANPQQGQYWLSYLAALIKAGRFENARQVLQQGRQFGLKGDQVDCLEQQLSAAEAAKQPETGPLLQVAPSLAEEEAFIAAFYAGHYAAAEQQALAMTCTYPSAAFGWKALGMLLKKTGRITESLMAKQKSVQLMPDDAEAHSNLGVTLQELGRLDEAEACYRQAIALKPDCTEAQSNLGNLLQVLGQLDEAEIRCRQAIALTPDYPAAHSNLGMVVQDLGRFDEAEACYRQAIALKPDYTDAYSNLLFLLNYVANKQSSSYLEEARSYGAMVSSWVKEKFAAWQCAPHPERLRIGLVSGDLRNHPVGYFMESILTGLDSARIELIAYPTRDSADELTVRIKPYCAAWKPLVGLSDEAAACLIHGDGVHILIDLAGHTAHNRLPLFAWKPAPVQVTWLGYFATTGVAEMDYLLGDPYNTPADEAGHFTEAIWRLPETSLCFTPPDVTVEVGPLPALSAGYLTFGCFNNLTKMNDAVVELWAKVLQAVPQARLFLKAKQLDDAATCEQTLQRFSAQGISPDRLRLEGLSFRADYLQAYNHVDIALDPFPFPGGTTSAEGLWMGVPVLTRKGERFISHQGESILNNAGLPDWIAVDDNDYVTKAVQHAANLDALATLRAGLRRQVLVSPLFDASRFARNLETALWGMWEKLRG